MGTTIIEQAIIRVVDEKCEDERWIIELSKTVKKLNNGYYNKEWVDVIYQDYRDRVDIYTAYAFINVWCWLCTADIVSCAIYIGKTPYADEEINLNNDALQGLNGIRAKFYGGTQDEDGYIILDKPLLFDMENKETGEIITKKLDGYFPLEVGYQSAKKTMVSLNGGCFRLARWPYESEWIYLLHREPRDILSI